MPTAKPKTASLVFETPFKPLGLQGSDINKISQVHTHTHTAQQTHVTHITRNASMECIQHINTTYIQYRQHVTYIMHTNMTRTTHIANTAHTCNNAYILQVFTHTPPHVSQCLPHRQEDASGVPAPILSSHLDGTECHTKEEVIPVHFHEAF